MIWALIALLWILAAAFVVAVVACGSRAREDRDD